MGNWKLFLSAICSFGHLYITYNKVFTVFSGFFGCYYLEMGTRMLENILRIRCMALASIVLQMGIDMREPGMKVKGKALECTHSEMERLNLVTGKMECLMSQVHNKKIYCNSKGKISLQILGI